MRGNNKTRAEERAAIRKAEKAERKAQKIKETSVATSEDVLLIREKVVVLEEKLETYKNVYGDLHGTKKNKKIPSAGEIFLVIKQIAEIYGELDKVIDDYHHNFLLFKGQIDGQEDKLNEGERRFRYIWKNLFSDLVGEIDICLSQALALLRERKYDLMGYKDEQTGDNFLHLLVGHKVPIIYLSQYLDINNFKAEYISNLFFVLNKQGVSPYKLVLEQNQTLGNDYTVSMHARQSAIYLGDNLDIEGVTEQQQFKTMLKAREIALNERGNFGANFNSLCLFVNRSKASNTRALSHAILGLTNTYLFLMIKLAYRERAFALSDALHKTSKEMEHSRKESFFGMILPESMANSVREVVSSSLEVQRQENRLYSDMLSSTGLGLFKGSNLLGSGLEVDVLKLFQGRLESNMQKIDAKFVQDLVPAISSVILDLFGRDRDYQDRLFYFKNSSAKKIVLYSSTLYTLLEKTFTFFVSQIHIEISDEHQQMHSLLLESVINYCLEYGFDLNKEAVAEVNNIGGELCMLQDILAHNLARMSQMYYQSYIENLDSNKRLSAGFLEAERATIECFNLFWQKISKERQKEVVTNHSFLGHSALSVAVENGSYDFLVNIVNLIKKLKRSQDFDLDREIRSSRPLLVVAVARFDFRRLKCLLDSGLGFSLDEKFLRFSEGEYRSLDLLCLCLDLIEDKNVYKLKSEEIDKMVEFLKYRLESYDQEMAIYLLEKKGLLGTELENILLSEAKISVLEDSEDGFKEMSDAQKSAVVKSDKSTELFPGDKVIDISHIHPLRKQPLSVFSAFDVAKSEASLEREKKEKGQIEKNSAHEEIKETAAINGIASMNLKVNKVKEEKSKLGTKTPKVPTQKPKTFALQTEDVTQDTKKKSENQIAAKKKPDYRINEILQFLGFALDGHEDCCQKFIELMKQFSKQFSERDIQDCLYVIATTKVKLKENLYKDLLSEIFSYFETKEQSKCILGEEDLFLKKIRNEDRTFIDVFLKKAPEIFYAELERKMLKVIEHASVEMFFFLRNKKEGFDDYQDQMGHNIVEIAKSLKKPSEYQKFVKRYKELCPEKFQIQDEKEDRAVQILEKPRDVCAQEQEGQRISKHERLESESAILIAQQDKANKTAEKEDREYSLAQKINQQIHRRFRSMTTIEESIELLLPSRGESEISYHGSGVYCALLNEVMPESNLAGVIRRYPKDLNARIGISSDDFLRIRIDKIISSFVEKGFVVEMGADNKRLGYLNFALYASDGNRYQVTVFDKEERSKMQVFSNIESFCLDFHAGEPVLRNSFLSDQQKLISQMQHPGNFVMYNFSNKMVEKIFFGPIRYPEGVLLGNREPIGISLQSMFSSPYGDCLRSYFLMQGDYLADYEKALVNVANARATGYVLFPEQQKDRSMCY